jgi:hypothetical protein|tara:strand:+ start:151 stop:360 length:210 start_codon:yes stop_codon:yes gene_type:complete
VVQVVQVEVLVQVQMELIQFLVQLLLLHQQVVELELEDLQEQPQMVMLVVQEVGLMVILLLVELETHLQ